MDDTVPKFPRIAMNYKNLNYEIETHRADCTMNYKNLNYEIETIFLTPVAMPQL